MQLGSPRWGTKELPEEYRGRTCPRYSCAANIAGCHPISLKRSSNAPIRTRHAERLSEVIGKSSRITQTESAPCSGMLKYDGRTEGPDKDDSVRAH